MFSTLNPAQRLSPRGLPTAVAGTTIRHFAMLPEVLTKVTINAVVVGGDNASLAVGMPIFRPGANAVILSAEMNIILRHQDVGAQDETPDVGLGTVIATGAVATLDGTATFENIITGQTSGVIDGTNTIRACNRNLVQPVTANGVFLNFAAVWDNITDLDVDVTGNCWFRWRPAAF